MELEAGVLGRRGIVPFLAQAMSPVEDIPGFGSGAVPSSLGGSRWRLSMGNR